MGKQPEFVQRYVRAAKTLLKSQKVLDPLFSRGTYQVEIQEAARKKQFPFLQIQEDGTVADSFCSCSEGTGCVHLAAAYLKIFNGHEEPLHVRFKRSLWNRLFQMASRRHGDDPSILTKGKAGVYFCDSSVKKRLFEIEAKSAKARKRLEALISNPLKETEETSLKFSNWPPEEMAEYRAGRGSPTLLFELSFWSDLAKWVMALQEAQAPCKIRFEGSPLPHEARIDFPDVALLFYISEASWPFLIDALDTVDSPLKVFDPPGEAIDGIDYDPIEQKLVIHRKEKKALDVSEIEGIPVGDWVFVEGKGFCRKGTSPLFQREFIPKDLIAEALNGLSDKLKRFLPIQSEEVQARYRLYFDSDSSLHIECFLFEPGDLSRESSALFLPWAYIEGKGFIRVEEWMFEGREKVIPKEAVAEFINKHRVWLQNFPGFQTHLGSLEAYLVYRLSSEGELSFDAELNFPEGFEEARHFDEWVYLPGQGFYMKKESSSRLPLHPGLVVSAREVGPFIASHKDELEQVQKFFSPQSPILKTGLRVGLNSQGAIEVAPDRQYAPEVDPSSIQFFGSYLYEKGKGFTEIPASWRLPERFQEKTVIPANQETVFLSYELEPLKSFIIYLDPRLKKPLDLRLKIRRLTRDKKKRSEEWLADLVYQSEEGSVDPIAIWDAMQHNRRHLFSPAGLLGLRESRFNWIRQLSKHKLDRKKGMIRLNTLEWIRLTVFEELEPPRGSEPQAVETRKLIEELARLDTHRLLDVSKLKSTLRPYQEQGLQWLWFLYCHGLSGLLCDDMGLGKTHQAMALLAAVESEDEAKENKYLVVCPTSVIYHWQELLKRFLPDCRVCTYYGLARSLAGFADDYDLLLTSYGILRTGKENLRAIRFEVAVFDEIHVAKNYASQTHKALKEVRASMRLGLSGTPIENRLRELKFLLDIVLPSYLPQDAVFKDLFIQPIEKQNDAEKKALLARLVKPFILRRKKSEVLTDLPEKIEETAYCDLSEEQKALYKEVAIRMRDTLYQELKDPDKPVAYLHVFAALMKLKQICNHPALYLGETKKYLEHFSGKWDLFVELLHEAIGSGQKVVVFSQYLDMLGMIESYCRKKGIGFASIKGSTRDRNEQLRKFREEPECSVFVASLLAAGVGIDLTVASIVIHYDRWWNPAKENQATDRVHRIGQSRGVQVFKFITKNTIEEHIHELIEKKKGLLDSIVGVEDQITYLSREELLQVFEKMFGEEGIS